MNTPSPIDWQICVLPECASTFNEARRYPAWCAVRAVRQVQGRGRFNRTWYGEAGGLWVTYNVPLEGERNWGLLPLVAGAAIMRALRPYAIPGLRLRWPNDVLVGKSKLAGILVERPSARMASIGIGINMFNDVKSLEGLVQDPPARLADLAPHCPSVESFCSLLAADVAAVMADFTELGAEALLAELAPAWGQPRSVEVQTDEGNIYGEFIGVLADGSPLLRTPDGGSLAVPGITVNRMRELD